MAVRARFCAVCAARVRSCALFADFPEHRNYVGFDDRAGPVCVSIKKEPIARKDAADREEDYQYRAIFRTREGDLRTVFPSTSVLSKKIGKPSWKDVIRTVNPSLKASKLKKVNDAKIRDELVRFDEQQVSLAHAPLDSAALVLILPFRTAH